MSDALALLVSGGLAVWTLVIYVQLIARGLVMAQQIDRFGPIWSRILALWGLAVALAPFAVCCLPAMNVPVAVAVLFAIPTVVAGWLVACLVTLLRLALHVSRAEGLDLWTRERGPPQD